MSNTTDRDATQWASPAESAPRSPWSRPTLIAIGLCLVQLVVLVLTVWPVVRMSPREVPIALAGPPAATAVIKRQIEAASPGAFKFHEATDEARARKLIKDAEVYGAIVIGQRGPKVLTATGASPAVADILNTMAAGMSRAPVPVEDVITVSHDDPTKAGLASSLLLLLGIAAAAGALLALQVRQANWRWIGLALFVAVSAPSSAALLNGWLGVLEGDYLSVTAVVALASLAAALPVMGAAVLFGPVGAQLSVLVLLLLSPPVAAVPTGPEILPRPWGTIGGLLPPGAIGDLLRSVVYFGGGGAAGPAVVLLVWCAAGAVMALAAPLLKRPRAQLGRHTGVRGGEAPAPAN